MITLEKLSKDFEYKQGEWFFNADPMDLIYVETSPDLIYCLCSQKRNIESISEIYKALILEKYDY